MPVDGHRKSAFEKAKVQATITREKEQENHDKLNSYG